jgi:cyclopropane fatty-acyl-phospholipid synthase-like methyltransferase
MLRDEHWVVPPRSLFPVVVYPHTGMGQTTSGVRAVLSIPRVYSLFRSIVSGPSQQRTYVRDYVHARPGDRILDIGCGPADVLEYLPADVHYDGFDLSESYIERARWRWGDRGTFRCAKVDAGVVGAGEAYDVVLANGVVHHLEDAEAESLFRVAHDALKPGGRLVTLDGCYVAGQSAVARYLLSRDRGRNVRAAEAYEALARRVFSDVTLHIRHDLLRIPYTLLIMECRR